MLHWFLLYIRLSAGSTKTVSSTATIAEVTVPRSSAIWCWSQGFRRNSFRYSVLRSYWFWIEFLDGVSNGGV